MKSPRILPLFCILAILLVPGCREATREDVEKAIREGMKKKMNIDIDSLELTKLGEGNHRYVGTATAKNGDVYDVMGRAYAHNQIDWGARPGPAFVEKQVRAGLEEKFKAKVKSLHLSKQASNWPPNYSGAAELVDGRKLNVTTRVESDDLRWEAKPAT